MFLSDTPEWNNDKKIVLVAVQQYGEALKYASDELKSNKEFILTVIKQNGIACEYSLLKDYQNFAKVC